jgi:ubiquinone/menaquinone biosynthesis C-methylase UbiE
MREVPKQIWAVHWNAEGAVTNGAWADTIRHFGGGVEYIRADHVDAMLKAERERARDEKDAYWKAYLTEQAALNRLAEKAVREKALREAARVLLDRWIAGEFEDNADAVADDAISEQWAHVDRTSPDAGPIIEAWLRAIAEGKK